MNFSRFSAFSAITGSAERKKFAPDAPFSDNFRVFAQSGPKGAADPARQTRLAPCAAVSSSPSPGRYRDAPAATRRSAKSAKFPITDAVRLSIQPNILHAPAVEQAVDHDRQSLELRLPAGRKAIVEKDRPRTILLQLPVDVPDKMLALGLIPLSRLLIEELVDLRITIAGVITVRAAGVILIEQGRRPRRRSDLDRPCNPCGKPWETRWRFRPLRVRRRCRYP